MAETEFGLNHPLAVKLWSRRLEREALKRTWAGKFMSTKPNSIIHIKNETSKSAGDKVTFGLKYQLSNPGIAADNTLEGNEEALSLYSDAVVIDQLRNAVKSKGKMSEQRVPYSMREEAFDSLADWWSDRIDYWFINAVTGYTGQADTRYTGMQATTAPTTTSGNTRWLFGGGATNLPTTEGSLSTVETMQLTYIDRCVATAKTSQPLIRPVRVNGDDFYVMFLHPWQVYSLRTDATAGRITWYTTQKARIEGGQTGESDNPIFSGALGVYNNVILHESVRLPSGSTNTRRAVFCGAQAAAMAFGQNTEQGDTPNWQEKSFDYGNQLGVAGGMIAGLKKCVFNSIDFGTIVLSTYATAP